MFGCQYTGCANEGKPYRKNRNPRRLVVPLSGALCYKGAKSKTIEKHMRKLKALLQEFCGYIVAGLAVALLAYTAACAPRPQEQWNSYYYGSAPSMSNGIISYEGVDADDNYVMPQDMRFPADDRSLQEENALYGNRFR